MVAAVVCLLWARPLSYPLKAAALATGTVLGSPHVFGYDLCILTIAAAFIVKDGLSRGFLLGEPMLMLLCWAVLLVPFGPLPAFVCLALLALIGRRAQRCRSIEASRPAPLLQSRTQEP
jgi:hypothetical protein